VPDVGTTLQAEALASCQEQRDDKGVCIDWRFSARMICTHQAQVDTVLFSFFRTNILLAPWMGNANGDHFTGEWAAVAFVLTDLFLRTAV
jgi:hypothetical protein